MEKDLASIKQKSFRYWFEDGLSDIVIGILFIIIGILNLIQGFLEPGSALAGWYGLVVPVAIIAGVLVSRRLIKTLKEHFTYPRTGYISYRKSSSLQNILSVIFGVSVALIVAVLWRASPRTSLIWTPLILGFILAGFLFLIGLRSAMVRYQIIAIPVVIIGLLLSTLSIPEWESTGIILSSMGLMLIFSGIIVLVRYLRSTQPRLEANHAS